MRIRNLLYAGLMFGYSSTVAQNIAIGVPTTSRAKLEVQGGPGNVSGIFGTSNGISVGFSPATISFNAYSNKYMGNGYAAKLLHDGTATTGLQFNFFPSGITEGTLGAATPVLRLVTSTGTKILTIANDAYTLDVARGTAVNGTAMFSGTNYNSHINYSGNEDTYIRGGKPASNVHINDTGGDVVIGSGSSIVGINYNNPVYTFEVRQSGGTGMRMGSNDNHNWEWRVAGSPANFYLRYGGAIHAYLRPSDGYIISGSDSRLKNNIANFNPQLEKLMQLRPVTYVMKDENPLNIPSLGLIAQEVTSIFPELAIQPVNKDQMMGVNYTSLVVVAVTAVQEEQKRLDELEKKIVDVEKLAAKFERQLHNHKE
jgi:hypothetical protein